MIKCRASPIGRRMAQRAILRESRGHVIGIAGALVILYMAGITCGALRRIRIHRVTSRARGAGVFAGQRKLG